MLIYKLNIKTCLYFSMKQNEMFELLLFLIFCYVSVYLISLDFDAQVNHMDNKLTIINFDKGK